nr:hypothetical protein Iba_chr05aCG8610 [Ipomoea batatas]GMC93874.1 hypothetical protein Iba_chr05bCG6560 [Ipomoea batatas]GMC97780.1 hypothetical protein Iba_chr05dCG10300 [Ipomoea batatas]
MKLQVETMKQIHKHLSSVQHHWFIKRFANLQAILKMKLQVETMKQIHKHLSSVQHHWFVKRFANLQTYSICTRTSCSNMLRSRILFYLNILVKLKGHHMLVALDQKWLLVEKSLKAMNFSLH